VSMIEVKTAELIGPALDWAVAVALGWQMRRVPKDIDGNHGGEVLAPQDLSRDFQYPPRGAIPVGYFLRRWSADWSQGGPLIEKYAVKIEHFPGETIASKANARVAMNSTAYWQSGPTPLVALCRAIVSANLGDVVSVPAELVQQQEERGRKV